MIYAQQTSDERNPSVLSEKVFYDEALLNLFYAIHTSMDKTNITPRRYFMLLESYRQVYLNKRTTIVQRQKHLKSGVSKLSDARRVVDDLRRNAQDKQRELAIKQQEADEALKQITKSMGVS